MSSCCTTITARHATTVRRGTTHIQLLYNSLAASSSDGGQLFQFRDSHCRRHVHSNSKGLLNTNTVVQTLNNNTTIYYTARKSHFSTSTATTAAAVNDSNNNNGNDNVTANNKNDEDKSKMINDVIIIGGGPTGLLLSTLLTSYMNTTSSNNSNNNNNNINNNNNSMNGNSNNNNNNSRSFSHLLFDKRPIHQLLLHPQAHFINIRSMELLRAELPRVYNGIMKEMPPVQEWNGFHFGASVVVSSSGGGTDNNSNHVGGRRMARVIHPVEEPLRAGQCGDAILVPQEQQHRQQQQQQQKHQSKDATTAATTNHGHGTIGASATTSALDTNNDVVSTCRPAHLAQNKFVKLLLEEAKRRIDDQYTTTTTATTTTATTTTTTTTDSSLLHNNDMCNASEESSGSGISSGSAADKCLLYGQEVISISEQQQTTTTRPIITITTSTGQTHHTRYLIAADGVHSFIRKQYGIPMKGNEKMQHLLNVHFRTNDALSKVLMTNRSNNNNSDNDDDDNHHHHQAMLHFIYNPQLVGVFVCHDGRKGEWVLQIPFFPPFQTMNDFTEENVKEMIWAGLGVVRPARTAGTTSSSSSNDGDGDGDNNHDHVHDIDILSIRPWTMSSLVAQTYLNESKTVALVGDAAHAFPPAGGFGMNTGLQDVHNIAWRLALLLKREQRNEALPSAVSHGGESSPTPTTTSVPNASSFSASILAKYEQERKPIATQNAALSVRNYQRTLRIAKACYLDAQHPQLLMTLLQVPPMSFLPLQALQTMFRQLVQVAMMPLGSLTSSLQQTTTKSFHANHIEKNVRLILESGGSLPLVFPRYELGFAYDDDTISKKTVPNASEDTAGYYPRVKVGHRLPHVVVENLMCSNGNMNGWIVVGAPNQQARGASSLCNASAAGNSADASDSLYISLVDISSQLRSASSYSTPIFTLLAVGPTLTCPTSPVHNVVESITNKFDFPLVLAHVLSERLHDKASWNTNNPQDEVKLFVDEQQALMKLLKNEPSLSFSSECDQTDAIILVRPDGHVAAVSWIHTAKDGDNVDNILTQIQDVIEGGYRNAMGTF